MIMYCVFVLNSTCGSCTCIIDNMKLCIIIMLVSMHNVCVKFHGVYVIQCVYIIIQVVSAPIFHVNADDPEAVMQVCKGQC